MPVDQRTLQALAIFASGYAKRFMESGYDSVMETELGRKAQSLPAGSRYGIEAGLYALMAYASTSVKVTSPLGLLLKEVALDMPPEIAKRLINGAREECKNGSRAERGTEEEAVAAALHGLDDESLTTVARWLNTAAGNERNNEVVQVLARRIESTASSDGKREIANRADDPILDAAKGVNEWLVRAREQRQRRRQGTE